MLARSHAELLQDEIDKLKAWLRNEEYREHFLRKNLIDIYYKLLNKSSKAAVSRYHRSFIADYLEDACAVNAALANPHDQKALDTLFHRAELTYGSPDPERKAIGAGLMVLSIGLLALSVAFTCGLLVCAFPLTGFLLLLGGGAALIVGFGFFRAGLQQGMARELSDFASGLSQPSPA